MRKRIFSLTLALCLALSGLVFAVSADGAEGSALLFEEVFEDYEAGVNVSSTTMPSFFVCDYNSIGDGVIQVEEAANGNLYLLSHVFTQIYTKVPMLGAYEFSLDVHEAQGTVMSGVFVRAPKTDAAYYEGDGHPDTSVCLSGLLLYPHGNALDVNIKTYDAGASSTSFLQNNTVRFNLPDGVAYPYNLRVVDTCEEITIYVNDTLICRIVMSDPGKTYEKHQASDPCFGTAKLYDAEGNEKGTYTNTLMGSNNSTFGWTTRAANMIVDNVKVLGDEGLYAVSAAISKLPETITIRNKKDVAAARELYDSLSESQKAFVTNLDVLVAAEAVIAELDAVTTEAATTEAPNEAPTEVPTEAPAETSAEAPTEPATDPATEPSTDTSAETEPEVKVIDDSLAIWVLIAVMIVAICGTAAYITVRMKKGDEA